MSDFSVKSHPVRAYRPSYLNRRFFVMLAGMGTTAAQNPPVADPVSQAAAKIIFTGEGFGCGFG